MASSAIGQFLQVNIWCNVYIQTLVSLIAYCCLESTVSLKFYAQVYEQSDIHTCMNKLTASSKFRETDCKSRASTRSHVYWVRLYCSGPATHTIRHMYTPTKSTGSVWQPQSSTHRGVDGRWMDNGWCVAVTRQTCVPCMCAQWNGFRHIHTPTDFSCNACML